jgi:hypothetical protein
MSYPRGLEEDCVAFPDFLYQNRDAWSRSSSVLYFGWVETPREAKPSGGVDTEPAKRPEG